MTISIVTSSSSATGNGSTKTFAYTFAALSDSEVAVKVAGVVVSPALYSVARDTSDNQGGTITFLTAPANAAAIKIYSNPSFEQGADADNAGAFNLASLEEAFDRAAVRDIYIKGVIEGGELVGATGATGATGTAATISVGTVTGLSAGTTPTVVNTGSTAAAVLAFGIPAGATGASPSVTIGTVDTLSTGSSATASITGTTPNLILNLGIPIGATGSGSGVAWGAITGTLSSQTDLNTALNLKAPLAGPTFTGTLTAATAIVTANLSLSATSPVLSVGVTTAFGTVTPSLINMGGTFSTVAGANPKFKVFDDGTNIYGFGVSNNQLDYMAPTGATHNFYIGGSKVAEVTATEVKSGGIALAPKVSPTFTGTPLAPTAVAATNTTQIATTAYVKSQLYATLAAPALTGAATIDGNRLGYRGMPLVTVGATRDLALTDDACKLEITGTYTLTIQAPGTIAYDSAFACAGFVSSGTATIALGAGVSLYKNGSITSGAATVTVRGRFDLVRWTGNVWTINGTNVT